MIARIWQVITLTSQADSYVEFLKVKVLPGYREADGNKGIYVFRDRQGEITHFLLLSLWSSYEKLINFTGADGAKAKLCVEEKRYLLAFESIVKQYEVVSEMT